jgi:small conductance mechanosensitive channel
MEIVVNILKTIKPWLVSHGLKILAIVFVAWLIKSFSGALIERAVRKAVVAKNFISPEAEKKREDTLIKIFDTIVKVVVWAVAAIMVVSEFGVEIGPMIAAAGIIGVAVGFGGQYLIRDLISGLFVILENQYRIGDVVKTGDIAGTVEDITLRILVLRDLDGTVHHIPHGEITKLSNLSKEFARVNIDLGVAYDTDLEKLIKVINDVGQELASDSEWKDLIIDAPKFIRVNEFADSAIVVKILGDTKPLQQWAVAGELRKRLKIVFDKEGIEIPFPQRVVHQAKK